MLVNFATKMNGALTQKQKEQAVASSLLKEYGPKWYELAIEARQNLREARYASMFLGVSEEPTQEQKEQAAQSITKLLPAPDAPIFRIIDGLETSPDPTVEIPFDSDVDITTSEQFLEASEDAALAPTAANQTEIEKAVNKAFSTEPKTETFSLSIVLNDKQLLAVDFARAGKCFVYTGPAGCGKTTGCREIARILLQTGALGTHDFKIRGTGERVEAPSIAIVAYTNRAATNMRNAIHKDEYLAERLPVNVTTIHNLLEYEPEFYAREDGSTGMRFTPRRDHTNPVRITHLVIEESSMVGIDLWLKLFDALLPGTQIIFVGDINQLQPIFAPSILNYALVTLPVVELTEVYRQAADGPIIPNAHRCLRGEKLIDSGDNRFRIISGKDIRTIPSESKVVNLFVGSLKKWNNTLQEDGQLVYDPEQDIVLCPFGKENKDRGGQANTTVINNHIAQFLGAARNAMVYEVIAGMRKLYLAVGDRVMIDKQDGKIVRIIHNASYIGRPAMPASTELTRFGVRILGSASISEDEDFELAMEGYGNIDVSKIGDEDAEPKRAASHIVDVLLDNGNTVVLDAAGEFAESSFSLGYALTIHKAQGCEWRKVFILLHRIHATMLSRELIYTAITRAREYCIIIDLCNQLDKAIANQRIKGNSVQEKIEWFNSEVSLEEPVPVVP